MPTITIRTVSVNETNINLGIEFDYALETGGSMETINISVRKPEYLFWKETANPAADGVLDYIRTLVQPRYEKLKAQRDLATALNLVDAEITW